MQKKSTGYLSKGLILSLIFIIINLIGGFAHIELETWFKWLPSIILIIALIFFCIQYGKELNGQVTFGNVFGYGIKITTVVAVVMFFYTIISLTLIFPELKDHVIEKARADMEAKGGLSDDQMETGLNMTRRFFLPIAMLGVIFGTYLMGLIGSLLGAAFTKKAEPNLFQGNP